MIRNCIALTAIIAAASFSNAYAQAAADKVAAAQRPGRCQMSITLVLALEP